MYEDHQILETKSSDASISDNNALSSAKKIDNFENVMISVGTLITYTFKSAALTSVKLVAAAAKKIALIVLPLKSDLHASLKRNVRNAAVKFVKFADSVVNTEKTFSQRKNELGFGKALSLLFKDGFSHVKQNKFILKSFVNYAMPVLSIAVLVSVISRTSSVDYGISVGFNGQELGVVTAESVIDEAQKTISERATYYDTGSLDSVAASFSIKPLGSEDEVIDEDALVNKIAEQIPEIDFNTEIPTGEDALLFTNIESNTPVENNDDKVRAFVVTVDGRPIGAVSEFNQIENYLEATRARYLADDVISVGFDKEIEYGYEQYVMPSEIVTQQDIINIFSSVVSEPVYYEVASGDNPWDIALDNNLSVEQLKMCYSTFNGSVISDITTDCPVGAIIQLSAEVPYLQVELTKEIEYTELIDYDFIRTDDADLYKGDKKVDVKGVEGEVKVTALATYKNGTRIGLEVTNRETISEPIAQRERVGTRATTTPVSTGDGGSGDYFWPVGGGYISAYQGDRRNHKGIDIAAPYGTPIYATANGTVTRAGNKGDGYGNCVVIAQDDSNSSLYGHMSSIAISNGDYVIEGQIIGYVGSTGDSTGNHLHFEVISSSGKALNPCDYVTQ